MTSPLSGLIYHAINFISVVLPHPLGPTNAAFFHQARVREKLFNTLEVEEYAKEIFLSSILSDFDINVFASGFSLWMGMLSKVSKSLSTWIIHL